MWWLWREISIGFIYTVGQKSRPNIANHFGGFWAPERTNITRNVKTFDKQT